MHLLNIHISQKGNKNRLTNITVSDIILLLAFRLYAKSNFPKKFTEILDLWQQAINRTRDTQIEQQ